ncbi:MAG: inositol monophosphatase family protein [Acidobacteriota bacterium]
MTGEEPLSLRETAIRAARIGGEVLIRKYAQFSRTIDRKGRRDFVTDADRESEKQIVAFLRKARPDDAIRAEESDAEADPKRILWAIDPLDGTTNFIHRYPCFSVSVGVLRNGEVVAGAVFDPTRGELFDAALGSGARLNGVRIEVSGNRNLEDCLLVTGFPFREPERLEEFLVGFSSLFREVSGIRRDGSAALDLSYVACGRVDGFWERGLSLWDIAAGTLLVREAGGMVTDLEGGSTHLDTGDILAANPLVFEPIRSLLAGNSHRCSDRSDL